MKYSKRIVVGIFVAVIAFSTFAYGDDDDEGGEGEEIPSSMVGTDCTECHGDKYADLAGASGGATATGGIKIPSSMVGTDCTECHGNKYADLSGTASAPPTATTTTSDGATLYQSNCASCHGSVGSSDVKKTTAAKITSAIKNNDGGMKKLSSLIASQIQAIASALGGGTSAPSTAPTPIQVLTPAQLPTLQTANLQFINSGPPDGASLYQVYCSSCHSPLSASAKRGATPAAVQSAIINNWGGMGYLAQLSLFQIQAISSALSKVMPPSASSSGLVDGGALYMVKCSSCHGAIASSNVKGAAPSSIQSAINGNWGGMGYLSDMTSNQIQAISETLTP